MSRTVFADIQRAIEWLDHHYVFNDNTVSFCTLYCIAVIQHHLIFSSIHHEAAAR